MPDEQRSGSDQEQQFEHGRAAERASEAAKPSDVGALDGAAAAGSAAAVSGESGDEEAIPTSAPDPTVGPD